MTSSPASTQSRRAFTATALLACLAAGLQPGFSRAAAVEPAFEAAYAQFDRANRGDHSAIAPSADAFASLAAQNPGDPVLLAYAGAAGAMRAKATMLPWKKMGFAEDGLAQIDKALALLGPGADAPLYRHTPASLETRFVAAGTFLALPPTFNRHARGEKLLAEVLNHPLFTSSPVPFKAAVWLRAGMTAGKERPDEARQWLQRVVDAQAPQAALAQAQLRELGL
jgi:hypothetical protein